MRDDEEEMYLDSGSFPTLTTLPWSQAKIIKDKRCISPNHRGSYLHMLWKHLVDWLPSEKCPTI